MGIELRGMYTKALRITTSMLLEKNQQGSYCSEILLLIL